MTDAPGDVLPFRRPPIRQSTLVRSDVAHTFEVFVGTIARWWPLRPYSIGQGRVTDVVLEREVGGLVYEVWDDGRTVTWGRLLAWEPPARFVLTWELLPAVTEVELSFTSVRPSLTRVDVEHRGWEALTEEQLLAATGAAGGYSAGWAAILTAFATAVEAAP